MVHELWNGRCQQRESNSDLVAETPSPSELLGDQVPCPAAPKLSSAASSRLSAITELKRLGLCSGSGFGFRKCSGWFDLSRPNFLPISTKAASFSHHYCAHWRSTFDFLQELFVGIHNRADWHKRPRLWPVWAFSVPPSLSLTVLSF